MSSLIDKLADECGIASSSVDAFGEEHQVSPELKRTLLEAMGIEAADESQAGSALEGLVRAEWDRVLPPVVVVARNEGQPEVNVTLPRGSDAVRWRLQTEDGGEREGEARFAKMPLVAERKQDGRTLERRTLRLPVDLPWGYHTLRLDGERAAESKVIVGPGRCFLPKVDEGQRLWGLAVSLFVVRSERNWGIGDFTDLREIVRLARELGADAVGVNPLHAMFLDKPEDASPYSPSDRMLLNVLAIDVEAIPELRYSDEAQQLIGTAQFQERLQTARNSSLVQYEAVAELKLSVLRLLFGTFLARQDPERVAAMEAFHAERREMLDRACTFQALRAWFGRESPPRPDCHDWPEEFRDLRSEAVAEFVEKQAELVRFHLWMQWIADSQLAEVAEAASGMAVGLYRDLAVGAHPAGAEVWSHPEQLVSTATVGAPPDILGPAGQNWGLPPLDPRAAREHAYSSFIDLLRANMRYAGGLRIDHAMALQRLFWVPKGKDPRDGGYVQYPMEDLLGILALESERQQCLVVGEDLGTVPEGFRERMERANVLSYRVLFFECKDGRFVPPEEYPRLSLSVGSNHDLPTVRGWWEGSDLDLKERLGLFPKGPEAARKQRAQERDGLLQALRAEGLESGTEGGESEAVVRAVHRYLARTNSLLSLLQMDDLSGEADQLNLPGTTDQYPNWRRKLALTLEELRESATVAELAEAMRSERHAREAEPVR